MESIIIKNKVAVDKMRIAGKLLAKIMNDIQQDVCEGVSTHEIDAKLEAAMRAAGLKPECKGYAGYRHATCISVNDVIVHGVPSKEIILKSGDFVKIDVVGSYRGYCVDMARGFLIGHVNPVAKNMMLVAQNALDKAISIAKPGIRLSDLSSLIQETVEIAGYGVVRDFAGHGIGKSIHEGPTIPNYGSPGKGIFLREGMALAIEPMITEKDYKVRVMSDGWTAKTVDGGLAAHVEDTVIITSTGTEILTRLV